RSDKCARYFRSDVVVDDFGCAERLQRLGDVAVATASVQCSSAEIGTHGFQLLFQRLKVNRSDARKALLFCRGPAGREQRGERRRIVGYRGAVGGEAG